MDKFNPILQIDRLIEDYRKKWIDISDWTYKIVCSRDFWNLTIQCLTRPIDQNWKFVKDGSQLEYPYYDIFGWKIKTASLFAFLQWLPYRRHCFEPYLLRYYRQKPKQKGRRIMRWQGGNYTCRRRHHCCVVRWFGQWCKSKYFGHPYL